MILVFASIVDPTAVTFAEECASGTAVSVVTLRDVAEEPISLRSPDFAASTITVRGQELPITSITGAINLLPTVFPDELIFYDPAEREYQASEFHALLTFLLAALPCPVVNRPTPSSLSGPYATPFGWHHLARGLGVPAVSLAVDSDAFRNPFAPREGQTIVEAVCLGGSLVCPTGTAADDYTLALARTAEVAYLKAVYAVDGQEGPRFLTAQTIPDLRSRPTRRALLDYFARPG